MQKRKTRDFQKEKASEEPKIPREETKILNFQKINKLNSQLLKKKNLKRFSPLQRKCSSI